jgi:CBS domain-containing protein
MMVKYRIKKLCVVDNSNKVVGVVSEGDIVKNVNYLVDVLKEIIATGYSK